VAVYVPCPFTDNGRGKNKKESELIIKKVSGKILGNSK
jgi:hypothetical protein